MCFPPSKWILFVITLPTGGATTRMRIWRTLKALGCGALRDGVYVLPDTDVLRHQLTELADETVREGGTAWLLDVVPRGDEALRFQMLFDRTQEYAAFSSTLAAACETIVRLGPQEVNRTLRKLRKDYDALHAIDYFPGETSTRAEQAWKDFVTLAETILSTGEPQTIQAPIPRLNPSDYQRRLWATREGLWVDRVASAWLIRRFIDRDARFQWLRTAADCPAEALGFDFDGATFTHIGERVTFEVLLASFGLDQDPGLARLGTVVHALDIGNGFVPEAAGFEAMLSGLRQRARSDDELLAEVTPVLDALHAHFSTRPESRESAGEAK
jgi:hypothetical protein